MLNIESLKNTNVCIDDKWVIARPLRNSSLINLVHDLIEVIKGRADVVKFYKQ